MRPGFLVKETDGEAHAVGARVEGVIDEHEIAVEPNDLCSTMRRSKRGKALLDLENRAAERMTDCDGKRCEHRVRLARQRYAHGTVLVSTLLPKVERELARRSVEGAHTILEARGAGVGACAIERGGVSCVDHGDVALSLLGDQGAQAFARGVEDAASAWLEREELELLGGSRAPVVETAKVFLAE